MSAWLDEVGNGLRDCLTRERADQVQCAGHKDRLKWCEHAGGDDCGDRVGRVVEPVYELEPDTKKDDEREKDRRVVQLAVFHHDGLDDIGDILAAVDGGLHQ